MAKRHRRKSRRRKQPVSSATSWRPLPRIEWWVVKRGLHVLLWMTVVAGIMLGWTYGIPQLQARATELSASDHVEVVFVDPPPWFRGDLEETITRTAALQVSGDPMARNDLVAIHDSLSEIGWFNRIRQIRRTSSDRIEIDAEFVRPFAVIGDDEGDHLVDIAGKLLPRTYPAGSRTKFIRIAGAHFDRPLQSGELWEGADIAAAIDLLKLVDQQPWQSQVAEVDISGYLRGQPLKLITDTGSIIVWGNPPGEEAALELMADGKLNRLAYLYREHERIDGGHDGEVDITGEKAVVTR